MDGNEYLVSVLVQHRLDEARGFAAEQARARSARAGNGGIGSTLGAFGQWWRSRTRFVRGRLVGLSGARPSA
jgi:hypothetical protein